MSKKEKKNKHSEHSKVRKSDTRTAAADYPEKSVKLSIYLTFIPLLITASAGVYYVLNAKVLNGYFGFPLDDPWIHLTFARNLAEYGSFSFFKNELVVAGSTSPVYTLLLSVLLFIISNEYIVSYVIGIASGVLAVYMIIKLSSLHFGITGIFALLTGLLTALSPKINIINVSGMETSMFILFVAASLYYYKKGNAVLLGIFAGLTIWCRPDGIVLWIAIAIDYFLIKYYFSPGKEYIEGTDIPLKDIIKAFTIALLMAAAYFIFNYLLSGSIFPSTYSAKIEFYQNNSRSGFLVNEVLKYFTQSEFMFIWIPFIIGAAGIIISFVRKKNSALLVCLLFITGLIAVYYIKLPFAHRFGRYLIPVIPFYILIAVSGLKIAAGFIIRSLSKKSITPANIFLILFTASAVIFFIIENVKYSGEYTDLCRYHNQRHVAAGMWVNANTSVNEVIATHDIGAIGYYGNRRIIDMAGLVTPELTDHLNNRTYTEYLNKYLAEKEVDYIITLRNWFEVVNDKPVYVPVNEFEVLEIYKYRPGKTHIQPKEVSQLNQAAIYALQNGNPYNALNYLKMSLGMDNKSSQVHFLLGQAYRALQDHSNAEKHFKRAAELSGDSN